MFQLSEWRLTYGVKCTGKGKVLLSNLLPSKWCALLTHSFPKPFTDHIKPFSHHAPYLAIPPSAHFFTSFQPAFTYKTQHSQNFDWSLWADASEFPTGFSDPGQGITKLFYGLLSTRQAELSKAFSLQALPSLVHSHQHVFLSDHCCSLHMNSLSILITLHEQINCIMWIDHTQKTW